MVHKIEIVTDDIEEAVQFYTQKLGLTVVERFENDEDEDYVFLDAGSILLELMPQRTTRQEPGFHHISFEVDSVEDSAQELQDRGLRSPRSPLMSAGGPALAWVFSRGPTR